MQGPKVGVGVFVIKDSKILLGKRKGSHGAGLWSLPGGHLEAGETFEGTCRRELLEEIGVDIILPFTKVDFSEDFFEENDSHYVTCYFMVSGKNVPDEVPPVEPDKCEEWAWFSREDVPTPLFCQTEKVLEENGWMLL